MSISPLHSLHPSCYSLTLKENYCFIYEMQICPFIKNILFVYFGSEEVVHALLQEPFVDGHKLGDEGLEVVDGLLTELQAVLVVGGHLGHLRLELPVTVRHQLLQQALWRGQKRRVRNTH